MAWYGMGCTEERYGHVVTWCDGTVKDGVHWAVWCGMVLFGLVWYGTVMGD